MQFDGALIKEQNITFAVVVVQAHLLNSTQASNEAMRGLSRFFPGVPIVLMAQDYYGNPTYVGREDIVDFLANIDFSLFPWKTYNY